jgi:NADH-quinone oxidoreductase subunit L
VISQVPADHEAGTALVDQMEWQTPKPQEIDGPSPIHELGGSPEPGAEHAHSPEEVRAERLLTVVSVAIALLGIGIGWVVFKKRPLLQMPRILENKYYVDEIYDATIINPIVVGSREGLWKLFDQGVIDGLLHGIGDVVTETGTIVRRLQAGFVRAYAAIILLGALAVIGVFAYFGVRLVP